jgi:hypothetical protein
MENDGETGGAIGRQRAGPQEWRLSTGGPSHPSDSPAVSRHDDSVERPGGGGGLNCPLDEGLAEKVSDILSAETL